VHTENCGHLHSESPVFFSKHIGISIFVTEFWFLTY
jgi:hypothetical protein